MKKRGSKRTNASYKWWLLALSGLSIAAMVYAIQRAGTAGAESSPFNEQRADADLRTLVGFGPRPAGSDAIAKARNYIVSELEKVGLKPQLDEFNANTPKGVRKMVNIRAVRPGANSSILALAGHYDTKLYDFTFVGANDGGSSAAWLLEMARSTADLKLQNTIEFVFFDGEEAVGDWTDDDSLYGSRFDVDRRYRNGSLRDLKALILVDMIGEKNVRIPKESQSTDWLNSIIWNTAHSLGYSREFPNENQSVLDDHLPFLKAGIPAVDLIDIDYPYWHTVADTPDKTSAASLKIVGDTLLAWLVERAAPAD